MPQAEFEPAIPASERPQTHALERAASGLDIQLLFTVYSYDTRTVQVVNYVDQL